MKKMVLVAVLVLLPAAAVASIGKVVTLEGKGTRTPKGGAATELAIGTPIEISDTLKVAGGNLKIELNDGSQIALADKSELFIDDAQFSGQDCTGFLGTLKSGSLWTKVKKLVGGTKYEVKTERAVAGVRGTIFRIDADTLVKAAKGRRGTMVRVAQGVVKVNPSEATFKTIKAQTRAKGPKVQVDGPKEISADAWEDLFVKLSEGQSFIVGTDLWEAAELAEAQKNDAFARWLDKNP